MGFHLCTVKPVCSESVVQHVAEPHALLAPGHFYNEHSMPRLIYVSLLRPTNRTISDPRTYTAARHLESEQDGQFVEVSHSFI